MNFIAKQEEGLYPYLNPREMPENLIVNKGFKIYHLGVPFDDVYSFNGWYYSDNEEEKLLKRDDIFYQDTTFYAKWIVTPKRVQYHLDGGISHFNPTIIYGDQTYDLKDATKLGYDFVGWYNNANFDGSPLTVIPIKSLSMELYAKYIVKDYNIFYHSNEGVHYNQDSYTIESEIIELLSAEKFGYTFDGWYDNQEFLGDATTSIEKGSTGDKTLYAKYVEKEEVMVSNELELRGALNLSHVRTINFSSDITLSKDLIIDRALNIDTNEFQFDFNGYKLEFIQTLEESTYQLKGTFLNGVVILDNSNGHFDLEGLGDITLVASWEEISLKTIDEVLEESIGTEVNFKGVVTGFTDYNSSNKNYDKVWLEDETGAITIYRGTFLEGLAIGDKYEVIGTLATFNGLIQIAQGSTLNYIDGDNTITNAIITESIDELTIAYVAKELI